MKKNKTLLAVITALGMGTLGVANAQIALPENKGVSIGLPSQVSPGNKIEQDTAPLMRSIAKKKSEVDLKTLDRELEKMNDESLKDQINREKLLLELQYLSSGQLPPGQGKNLQNSGVGFNTPSASPAGFPGGPQNQQVVEEKVEGVRVLLVYGFEKNLKAKISVNDTGGYVVQKGDTLPDGRKVVSVSSNYLEVKGSGKSEKLPVLGNKPVGKSGGSWGDSGGGNRPSQQILIPSTAPAPPMK